MKTNDATTKHKTMGGEHIGVGIMILGLLCVILSSGCTSPYLSAAKKGDKEAQFKEGLMYAVGIQEAKKFSESDTAGELRRIRSYMNAEHYIHVPGAGEYPRGVDRAGVSSTGQYYDYSHQNWYGSAFDWFTQSAEQKYAPAMYHIGLMYQFGRGVPADQQKSIEWLRKASGLGYEPARKYLSGNY
jgi:FOG: TPR repeat, SEL1 subfamily